MQLFIATPISIHLSAAREGFIIADRHWAKRQLHISSTIISTCPGEKWEPSEWVCILQYMHFYNTEKFRL